MADVNNPTLVKFRKLILMDRFKEVQTKGKIIRAIEHSKKFGFISNSYFNNIENGKTSPSLETFLDMVEIMGYDIQFVPKPNQIQESPEVD